MEAESSIQIEGATAEIEAPTLPHSLVVTILRRLSPLSDAVLHVLRSGAVLGTSFRIENLATAAGVSDEEALAAVQSLRLHDFFADDGAKVRFRHDLIREAVYEDLGEPVRVSMHRRIGNALAKAEASPVEVAVHMARGAMAGDIEAADWMVQTALDPVMDIYTAKVLIERALEITPAHPRRAFLIVTLAWLLMRLGRPAAAIPRLQGLLAETSSRSERLDVAFSLMTARSTAGQTRDLRSLAAQVFDLTQQVDDPDRQHVLLEASWALALQGDLEGALVFTERAAGLARKSCDAKAAAIATYRSSSLLNMLCRSEEALTLSQPESFLLADEVVRSGRWLNRGRALADLDRIDEAETALGIGQTNAEKIGHLLHMAEIIMETAHLRYSIGKWDDSLLAAQTAESMSDEFDFVYSGPDPDCIVSWIAYHRREEDPLQPLQSPRPRSDSSGCLWLTLQAIAALGRKDIDDALEHARQILHQIATSPTERRYFDVLPVVARVALSGEDIETARSATDMAVRLAQRSDASGVLIAAARCSAIVERDALAGWRAIELARSSPRKLLAAEAIEDAATVLDHNKAVDVLREAMAIYEQIGAMRDRSRIAMRLNELGAPIADAPARPRAVSGWDSLTPAELKVVRLAAAGMTNREVASRLFISHRTVSTHLSHVFDKLGLRSRVDLAREAAQRFKPT